MNGFTFFHLAFFLIPFFFPDLFFAGDPPPVTVDESHPGSKKHGSGRHRQRSSG